VKEIRGLGVGKKAMECVVPAKIQAVKIAVQLGGIVFAKYGPEGYVSLQR